MNVRVPVLWALTVIFLTTAAASVMAQKAVQLTKLSSGKKIVISEGKQVAYKIKGEIGHHVGILESVSDSSLTIGNEVVALTQFEFFGRKKKGSGFWGPFLTLLGAGIFVDAVLIPSEDPCPGCIDAGSTGEGWAVVGAGAGLGIMALGINTVVRNSERDLNKGWKLETVSVNPGQQ